MSAVVILPSSVIPLTVILKVYVVADSRFGRLMFDEVVTNDCVSEDPIGW